VPNVHGEKILRYCWTAGSGLKKSELYTYFLHFVLSSLGWQRTEEKAKQPIKKKEMNESGPLKETIAVIA